MLQFQQKLHNKKIMEDIFIEYAQELNRSKIKKYRKEFQMGKFLVDYKK